MKPPDNIPKGGGITIGYPPTLVPLETNCRNDIIGGSELCQTGTFNCVVDTVTKTMLITGCDEYNAAAQTIGIQVLLRMQNPAAIGAPGNWDVKTWY